MDTSLWEIPASRLRAPADALERLRECFWPWGRNGPIPASPTAYRCECQEPSGQAQAEMGNGWGQSFSFLLSFALQIAHLSSYPQDILADNNHGCFAVGGMPILITLNAILATLVGRAQRQTQWLTQRTPYSSSSFHKKPRGVPSAAHFQTLISRYAYSAFFRYQETKSREDRAGPM